MFSRKIRLVAIPAVSIHSVFIMFDALNPIGWISESIKWTYIYPGWISKPFQKKL